MPGASGPTKTSLQSLLTQLDEIERGPGGGVITFPGGRLEVSNLGKVFWPAAGGSERTRPTSQRRPGPSGPGTLTKVDLLRHYVRIARTTRCPTGCESSASRRATRRGRTWSAGR